MTDPDIGDNPASWNNNQSQRPDEMPDLPQLNVVSDKEADMITFFANRSEGDTTAWITADVDVLVDLSEAR